MSGWLIFAELRCSVYGLKIGCSLMASRLLKEYDQVFGAKRKCIGRGFIIKSLASSEIIASSLRGKGLGERKSYFCSVFLIIK